MVAGNAIRSGYMKRLIHYNSDGFIQGTTRIQTDDKDISVLELLMTVCIGGLLLIILRHIAAILC